MIRRRDQQTREQWKGEIEIMAAFSVAIDGGVADSVQKNDGENVAEQNSRRGQKPAGPGATEHVNVQLLEEIGEKCVDLREESVGEQKGKAEEESDEKVTE